MIDQIIRALKPVLRGASRDPLAAVAVVAIIAGSGAVIVVVWLLR